MRGHQRFSFESTAVKWFRSVFSRHAKALRRVAVISVVAAGCWLAGEFSELNSFWLPTPVAAQEDAVQYGATPIGPYKDLDVRTGVYNNGQAALWDLHLIEYYRIFGPPQRARGHKPEQPINFNHITHVQLNQMDCQYCHWSVSKAAYAAIPEMETCMGCHKLVSSAALDGKSASAQTPAEKEKFKLSAQEVKKLEEYYQKGEQVPWVKVHVMPDYVHFNHKRHVKAGVACQECHGQVPNMPVVERVTSMKMGWCIECHRERGASIDCYTCHY